MANTLVPCGGNMNILRSTLKSKESIYRVVCTPDTDEIQVIRYFAPSTDGNITVIDFDEDKHGNLIFMVLIEEEF